MTSEIMVDVAIQQTRIALLEDRELVELYIDRQTSQRLTGNIYRAKVASVLPGMQAAFVDIGYEKNAFLYVSDALAAKNYKHSETETMPKQSRDYKIDELLTPGQEITVQVIKEAAGTKGPRVTTNITLPGRDLVLLPNNDYVGVSRRIENEKERCRLKNIAEKIKPEGKGIIIRTASEGKRLEDFERDLQFLLKLWDKIEQKEWKGNVPRCLHKDESIIYKVVRDMFTDDIDKFIINNRQQYEKVLDLAEMISPEFKLKVQFFNKDYDLFEFYQIESKIAKALSRKIWLKSGGYVIIDQTEALTVIDVNTGKYIGKHNLEETVLKTNLEAAQEIAKQLRLRDIGGIIIIDFIDMNEEEHQRMVLDTLKTYLKKDRSKSTVVGMTGLGLIEMTRKKIGQTLSSIIHTDCHCCGGTGKILSPESIAVTVEKEIINYVTNSTKEAIEIEVHPDVANILKNSDTKVIQHLERTYNKKMLLKGNESVKFDSIKIREIDNNSLVC